jgi:hypothetical protein
VEKKEQRKENLVVGREDRRRQINKERWIMDNSTSGGICQRVLRRTSWKIRKNRLAKP